MPRIKNKEDCLDIRLGSSRIIFKKQCKLTKTINDLLIGLFFVFGSVLTFLDFTILGTVLYFSGSLILACRSILSITENIAVENKVEETQQTQFNIE